jgi:iron complex transport system substrate-binding protein
MTPIRFIGSRTFRLRSKRRRTAKTPAAAVRPEVPICLALALTLLVAPLAAQRSGPTRIVSLVPAVTEMLFAIGAGPAVVGVSSFDRYPPEAATRPQVGALVDPDFERILRLRPDLVIVHHTQTELIGRLTRAGIASHTYRHAGLADVTSTLRELGTRVGRPDDAARVAKTIEAELASIRAASAGQPPQRTALVFGREPGALRGIYVSGGIGFLHDLLELAGAVNVFADVRREGLQISAEVLLARAPDVIIEIRSSQNWTPARAAEERAVWNRLPALPAVRNGRVHLLADDSLSVPGPRIVQSARAIAAVFR